MGDLVSPRPAVPSVRVQPRLGGGLCPISTVGGRTDIPRKVDLSSGRTLKSRVLAQKREIARAGTNATLRRLSSAPGVFGTGLVSFTYFKSIPVQWLKMDIESARDLARLDHPPVSNKPIAARSRDNLRTRHRQLSSLPTATACVASMLSERSSTCGSPAALSRLVGAGHLMRTRPGLRCLDCTIPINEVRCVARGGGWTANAQDLRRRSCSAVRTER
jgi:hypothetical protein